MYSEKTNVHTSVDMHFNKELEKVVKDSLCEKCPELVSYINWWANVKEVKSTSTGNV